MQPLLIFITFNLIFKLIFKCICFVLLANGVDDAEEMDEVSIFKNKKRTNSDQTRCNLEMFKFSNMLNL